MQPANQPSLLIKLAVFAGGLAALAFFAIWPMYQVLKNEPTVHVTFKGVIFGAMLTMAGLNLILLGDKGIPWKKKPEDPLTGFQKAAVAATVIAALLVTGLVWLFFNQHGYTMGF